MIDESYANRDKWIQSCILTVSRSPVSFYVVRC